MADQPGTVATNISQKFMEKRSALDVEASLKDNSVETFIQEKLTAILDAPDFETINNLMTQTGLTPAKSLVGRTFEILDFVVRESSDAYRNRDGDFKSAFEKWCVVKATDTATGEEFVIDGGGDQFIAGMIAMRERYGFPYQGTLLGQAMNSGHEMHYWRFLDPGRKPSKT